MAVVDLCCSKAVEDTQNHEGGIEAMDSAYTESRSTPLHVTHLQIAIRVLRPST
jgi:hypothetical protein